MEVFLHMKKVHCKWIYVFLLNIATCKLHCMNVSKIFMCWSLDMTFSEKNQLSNKCCEQTEVAEPFRQYEAK